MRAVPLRRLADTGWLTALPLLLNVISLGASAFIIRRLGEYAYGTIVVASGISGIATVLGNLGLRALYTKAVAGADDATTERLMAEQLGLRLILATVAGLVTVGTAIALYPGDLPLLACAGLQAVAFLLTIGWTVLADVLNARERFSQNSIIAFIAGAALTAASVIAVALGGGPVSVSASYVVGPLVNLGLLWLAIRKLGLRVKLGTTLGWTRYRSMIREARALAANDLLNIVTSRAQGVWAPLLFGKSLMGITSAGTMPASRLEMAADSAATAHFPAIASAHKAGDQGQVHHHVRSMFLLILMGTIPLAAFTWFGAPYIAELLFPGATQQTSADLCTFVIRVTGFGIPIGGVGVGMRYALQGVGMHSRNAKDQMKGTVIGAVVTLAFALLGGIKGFVLAGIARGLITRSFQSQTFSKAFPGLWADLPWQRMVAATTVPVAILTLGLYSSPPGLLRPMCVTIVAVGLYVAVLFRARLIDLGWPHRDPV